MRLAALTTTSDLITVTATPAAGTALLLAGQPYIVVSSTACFIKQGTAKLVTPATKANLVDTDYITIVVPGNTKIYEFDVSGNGVTSGRVQVNVSTDTTAAQVATRLKTAIEANQTSLVVTDNTGSLTVVQPDNIATFTENVAHVSFTIADATMTVTAADGSMWIPAVFQVELNGNQGPQIAIVRDAADGKASVTRGKQG